MAYETPETASLKRQVFNLASVTLAFSPADCGREVEVCCTQGLTFGVVSKEAEDVDSRDLGRECALLALLTGSSIHLRALAEVRGAEQLLAKERCGEKPLILNQKSEDFWLPLLLAVVRT